MINKCPNCSAAEFRANVMNENYELELANLRAKLKETEAALDISVDEHTQFSIENAQLRAELAKLNDLKSTMEIEIESLIKIASDWKNCGVKVASRLVLAGCKSDGILDGVDEIIAERDKLKAALNKISNYPSESIWSDDRDDAANEIVKIADIALGLREEEE